MPDGIQARMVSNCGSCEKYLQKQVKAVCRPEDCRITIRRRSPGRAIIIYFAVWKTGQTNQAFLSMKNYIYFSITAIILAMLSIL